MLVEILTFVSTELESEIHPWPEYFAEPEAQWVAATLQGWHWSERIREAA